MKKRLCSLLPLALLIGIVVVAFAEMESLNYRITTSVLSCGGTTVESPNYQMTGTIGQSSCIGLSSGTNSINYAGYWQPADLKIQEKFMPWIPLLLLDD